VGRYWPLLSLVGRPLSEVLERFDLHQTAPLLLYVNAVCQITVQASAAEAEAPFALAAMDYYFRGARHIRGGIGALANALISAIRAQGGEVRMPNRVKSLQRTAKGWRATLRDQEIEARTVIANLLPQDAQKLLGEDAAASPRLAQLAQQVSTGWGAAMLYLTLPKEAELAPKPFHWELVADESAPFQEGNHLFCSVSGPQDGPRGPRGERSVTVSTHVPLRDGAPSGARVQEIQSAMQRTLALRAPELWEQRRTMMTASPRTFARFTGRHLGLVGGIPRTVGLHHYAGIFPRPYAENLYLVGDSVFPGQSTLATALGGQKVAERVLSLLG
jgi:phytoene dehydrogenase-like protein